MSSGRAQQPIRVEIPEKVQHNWELLLTLIPPHPSGEETPQLMKLELDHPDTNTQRGETTLRLHWSNGVVLEAPICALLVQRVTVEEIKP